MGLNGAPDDFGASRAEGHGGEHADFMPGTIGVRRQAPGQAEASLGKALCSETMVKLVFVIRRREDLAPEEFHRYWLEEHGPLVRRLLEPLGARRYVQTHTLDSDLNGPLAASRGLGEAFDGLAEIWWDSLDDVVSAITSEDGQRANETLVKDEASFIDFARSSLFLTEEHAIFERRG